MGVPYGDRGYPPPHGLAPLKPTVSPRGRRGAHPRLHLGVLALPGDGGHLTDFVANLWSIGALVTLYNIGEAQTMVLLTPGGPRCLSPQVYSVVVSSHGLAMLLRPTLYTCVICTNIPH